jgi:hypothetical protein
MYSCTTWGCCQIFISTPNIVARKCKQEQRGSVKVLSNTWQHVCPLGHCRQMLYRGGQNWALIRGIIKSQPDRIYLSMGYLTTLSVAGLYSIGWTVDERWFKRKRSYSSTFFKGLRKTMIKLSQDSRCPGWDSNRAPPEYKTRVLQLRQYNFCRTRFT